MSLDDRRSLDVLDARLRAILPEEYQDSYDEVQPVSMGSAGLKYGSDGTVAWNEMWASFCDLAMAGGPPHKGTLLEPGVRTEIDAQPGRYADVVQEICRGIAMVTGLPVRQSPHPGWVRVTCLNEGMAAWLVRAIVMENIAARRERHALDLPAGPGFRLKKEIKNVITVIAKTCHYWVGHMPRQQQQSIATLFATMAAESPLVEPAVSRDAAPADAGHAVAAALADAIHRETGLRTSKHRYAGWLGVECPSVRVAVWMMRAMVVSNVLARREGAVLFVPVNPVSDPHGHVVSKALANVRTLAIAAGML